MAVGSNSISEVLGFNNKGKVVYLTSANNIKIIKKIIPNNRIYFETKIKWAAELTGKNSETPWIAESINISTEESIKYQYCIAVMQYKPLFYWIF